MKREYTSKNNYWNSAMLKSLPLGIQNFEEFKEKNLVYVDKTKLIYSLINTPKGLYFLSRPRRFGKTLLLSTLSCLFQGKKELFEGLWIYHCDWDWKSHPVVSIDFNRMDHKNPEALENSIHETLNSIIEKSELKISSTSIPMKFGDIIVALKEKAEAPVVVLIDEYDKPIISHLGKGEEEQTIAVKNHDVLKQLFGTLKAYDVAGVLRFIFLTGVSKFARVSVFSDLNSNSKYGIYADIFISHRGHRETGLAGKLGFRAQRE